MTTPPELRQTLEAAIAELQSRRAVLGDALVDAALTPMLERLAALGVQGEPEPVAPNRSLRQVSVLFLDIVGSTQLIQLLDPEEVQAVVDGALAAFSAIVTQHGGEVLRYAGDNLKAAFGAQGTREDDAERAVHCGLALLDEAARRGDEVRRLHGHAGFNARVGIHTGGVVRGGGVENDNSLSGLTVIIAARLEQAAPTGTLCISQDTWAMVRGLFDAQMQPPLMVKGVDEPLTCWLVQGPKPRAFRLHARGIRGQETPLIGRQAELARFEATLDALLTDRAPRAMTVIADAGLGKSRLLQEFQHILSAHPSTWWLMPARSQPSGALQPYGLLRDLLARRLEIADSDSADVARSKLVQGLAPWLNQANDPAPELLGHLIGLDFSAAPAVQRLSGDARLLRDRAITALRLWLKRLAASDGSPVVLLLDDLHWADDASLDALVALLKAASTEESGPLLALLCARPGLIERVPAWGEGLPQHERLTLEPLDATQGSALTRSLLQRLNPVPAALAELVERRAEGNPFYAEELVGMLLDQGVISSETDGSSDDTGAWRFHPERLNPQRLPTTLTGVLQARLDALEPTARRALQMASVIGPVFWDDALKALDAQGPSALPGLQRKSLVQPRPTSAFEDTAEEAFQHHLLHQVSYDTVLKPQKREAHARAAAWLTQRVGDRSDEYLGITAEHYARAGEPALALDWFIRAATRAENRHAFKASLQFLDRAEAQAALQSEPLPSARKARMLALRNRVSDHLALRDQQEQAIDELLALGEADGDLMSIAEALTGRTLLAYRTGRLELAEAAGRRGAELAERVDSASLAALCHGNLAWMAIERRAFDVAREELAAASRWAALARQRMERPSDGIYEVQMLIIESELHGAQHDDRARAAALTRALAIAATLYAPRLECSCREGVARLTLDSGDLAATAVHIEEMARLAAEFGLAHQAAHAQQVRAKMHLQAGQWNAAEREAAAGDAGYRALSDVFNALKCRSLQAEARWRGGQTGAALAIWQETATTLEQRGDAAGARAVRLRLADARAGSGQPEDIEAARQAALAELPALQAPDALAGADFALAARLSAWRVLRRAGDPAAAGQLALAAAELEQVLNGFSDPDVRERVRNSVPWHRDVVEAMHQSDAAA